MKDALMIIGVIVLIPAAFAIYGLWWWAAMFGVISVVLGVFEVLRVRKTGHTLSQKFWEFRQENPVGGWVIIAVMALAWVGLLLHLVGIP